ncbi:MAG TPA: nitrate- and nitrite sensing domain-containing protein [Streptosporangiaceae bacterium]|nr:nitrate- and nitrite sensing domain-containing protein [Streptosporangiaceae bacterium]
MRSRNNTPGSVRAAEGEQGPAGSAFSGTATDPGPKDQQNGQHALASDPGSGGPGGDAQPEAAAARPPSRHGLKNWRVRTRLLLLIAIPTLTAVVLGGLRVSSSVQTAQTYQRTLQLADLNLDITTLVQRLQDERDQTVVYIARNAARGQNAGNAAALQVLFTKRRATELAAAEVSRHLEQSGGLLSQADRQEASAALGDLQNLPNLRLEAMQSTLTAPVLQKYSRIITDMLVLEQNTGQGVGDVTLAETVRVLGLVSRMKEDASQQRAILTAALVQHTLDPGSRTALLAAQSDQAANQVSFSLSSTNAQRQLFQDSMRGSLVPLANSQIAGALALGTSLRNDPTTPDEFYGAMTNEVNTQLGTVERSLVNAITDRTVQLRNAAFVSALVVAIAVLLLLALSLLFTVMVARSMVRPLRRLRAGALEVAGVRLPETVRRMSESEGAAVPLEVEPIDVDSTDEIGEVARAFDQVHREALRLASNEAALRGNVNAMFVNLSRRSQSLVERQIRLIDDLEQGEQDAERLANLFQMDHLATRMRRNSENLLVLAGHEVSRRWTQSVALVDVLRAAVSEIEQYERVTLNVQPGISVRGQAVNDVVHLIAELAENASSFSAADTPVKVSGHLLNSGGVLLDITDQGVGMGAEEMAHANWRLDNPPVVDVAVSRRMGLFVVARLAARHGIRVRLRPASAGGGGLTALVWLPDEVISHGSATASPAGTRRFDTAPAASAAPSTATAAGAPEWPVAEGADSRSAAASAVNAARTPRFAPLRPDLGDTGAFSAIDAEQDAPAPAESGALAGFDIDSRSEAETSSMSAYDTGSMPAVDAGAAPPFSTGAAPPFGTGAPPPFGTGAAPTFDTGAAPAFGTGAAPTFDLGTPPAPDKEGASALEDSSPSAPAEGPLPVYGAPTRGERPVSAGPAGNGNELPFRTPAGQPAGGIIVPPTASAGAGEEHRLPIFESVESDWFRRGRHGASRAGQQVNSVASSGGWTSPADEGWRAAEAAHVPTSGGVTLSGLPKRVPRANLVPGAVGAEAAATAAPAPARSAAQARDRLASFQRGMREGRAAARDSDVPSGEDNSAI